MNGTKLSDDVIKAIINEYLAGNTSRAIGNKYNCNHKTVLKYVKSYGIDVINKGNNGNISIPEKINYDPENRDQLILELYAKKYSSIYISRALNISKKTVLMVLKKHNTPLNQYKHKTSLTSLDIITINKLYDNKKSITEIANQYNVYESVISNVLNNKRTPGQSMSSIVGKEDEIIRLYNDKKSTYDIAEELNINNPDRIATFLKKKGLLRSVDEIRIIVANKLSKNNGIYKSKIQSKIEALLCDMGYIIESEFNIDGWIFDIKVNKVLFEIQGGYWHKIKNRTKRDMKKREIAQAAGYKVVYIWEHQINNIENIKHIVQYHIDNRNISFNFNDIQIRENITDSKELLKYHYAGSGTRFKHNFVAYLGNIPIGTCVFSNVVRMETATKQNVQFKEILELSRFCIHPLYHKKNFASWFISKCIKKLHGVKVLVAFADSTYNHDGTIYKASNWKYDGVIPSDYWYVSGTRSVWHKKTVWNRAKKIGISESDYARANNLVKEYGMPKHRYIKQI